MKSFSGRERRPMLSARLWLSMRYVALLRGIGPANPNMKGERLKSAFEEIGFTNVHPVIASGNVIFDSPSKWGYDSGHDFFLRSV